MTYWDAFLSILASVLGIIGTVFGFYNQKEISDCQIKCNSHDLFSSIGID